MKIITSVPEMKEYSHRARREGKTIGFVPTMGAFHEGHLSLIRAAHAECDEAVVSIFVNALQFSPDEDFDKYPRDIAKDERLARNAGASVLFVPGQDDMYPEEFVSSVEVSGKCADSLCAAARPGHFKGVTTVVAKLFNICGPHIAYFGRKDFQQAAIVKQMVRDLNMSVTIRLMPIVRGKDGLALSSRNVYLSKEERLQAAAIYRSLEEARKMITGGELLAVRIKDEIKRILIAEKDIKIDYIEIVDGETLEPLYNARNNTLIAAAVYVGSTRLIDNITVNNE